MPQRRDAQALRAAQLYYVQHLTMDSIARDLGTSRSTVSRLLAYARDSGMVTISITDHQLQGPETAAAIARLFDVRAHVVPTDGGLGESQVLDRVALHAAGLVGQLVDSEMTVGVAWGSTVTALSRHLKRKPTHDTVIVQLNGSGNPQSSGIGYASDILHRFETAFTARVEQFPVPTFFDHPETRELMWQERSVRRVLDLHAHMGLAVFGLGTIGAEVPSHVYRGGYLSPADVRELRRQGVVGDIATVFYRSDGGTAEIDLNRRSTGPALEQLRQVPRRVCAVAGKSKVPALAAALTAGYITDLVVDEGAARRLIQFHERKQARRSPSREGGRLEA
ncbi:sugar-binding transcriptional regulator [Zhihengliuella sp.]|uniref:sugar-binding transcriptional regulator n=1 Tax=Zhihengliuella sp. TaxID=1954483 RepID=UPI002812083E|nr:sugar-binding transcriptional regulator [Zhihengliuella sp.]